MELEKNHSDRENKKTEKEKQRNALTGSKQINTIYMVLVTRMRPIGGVIIVKIAGQNKFYSYIGLVERLEGTDISAKILKRSRGGTTVGKAHLHIQRE